MGFWSACSNDPFDWKAFDSTVGHLQPSTETSLMTGGARGGGGEGGPCPTGSKIQNVPCASAQLCAAHLFTLAVRKKGADGFPGYPSASFAGRP